MIHIRSLVCAGINKRTDIDGNCKSNECTLARSLMTPTEAITFLTDYDIPGVLIPENLNEAFAQKANLRPELISRPTPKLTPGSPPEIQPIWRPMNEPLPLEAKLDPEAISVPAPTLAPGPPPETQPIWRPSPDDRTLSLTVQASVEEIGIVAFDELQHADALAQPISNDDTRSPRRARFLEDKSIASFSRANDKDPLGADDLAPLFSNDDRRSPRRARYSAAANDEGPPGDTQKCHFCQAGWRDNPRDDFCNISICQASLKRCIYKDGADILARKYLLLRRTEKTLLPM